MKRIYLFLVLAALFSMATYANFSVNTQFKPLHLDEYDHLAIAKETIDRQQLVFYNPFAESHPEQGFFHSRFESSFDTLLASLLILLPIKPINFTLPFTIFISMLIALAAFLFSKKIFNSNLAALIMAASIFFIENNFAFLGYLFVVPMSLASAIMLVLAYLLVKSINSTKYCILFLFMLANSVLIHPIFPLMVIAAAVVFILIQPKIVMRHKFKILLGAIVLIAGIAFIKLFTEFSLSEMFLWEYDIYAETYPLLEFIGLPMVLLALLGAGFLAFYLVKKRLPAEQSKYAIFLIVAAFVGLFIRLYGDHVRVCFLGPCRRTTNAFTLFAFLLVGVAIYVIVLALLKLFRGVSPSIKKACFLLIALAITVGFLSALEYTAFKHINEVIDKYQSLERSGIRAAEWLSARGIGTENVYALPWEGKGVFIVSGMKVSPTLSTRLGSIMLHELQQEKLVDLIDFFYLNCERKYAVIESVNASWIYSPGHEVSCVGINKLYQGSGENHSLYRVIERNI